MGKHFNGKACAIAAFAVGAAAIAHLAVRKIRNSHHPLMSDSGEALLASLGQADGQKSVTEGNAPGMTGDRSEAADVGSGEDAARTAGRAASVWNQYPRPQMRRDSFYSLNGYWELNGQKILVPFPPQATLSGYQGKVGSCLNYSREFTFPELAWEKQKGRRILLHFGAVDQVAEVFFNGHSLGRHEGGYLPFHFDVTEYVTDGTNRIDVKAKDTLSARYPYGKQRKARGGMWYTPVSGIWQSVWMECVPQVYIADLKVNADMEKVRISVTSSEAGRGKRPEGRRENAAGGMQIKITLHNGSLHTIQAAGTEAEIDMTKIRLPDGSLYRPILWNTEHPYLYRMIVTMGEDTVMSYFGLRTMEVKTIAGIPRVCLNGEPIFLQGVLDQGYFCDGLYLPARETAYEEDVLYMKSLGMNLLRKHIKIEPEAFYYYCDVHGMLVMQDMVNNGFYSWIKDTALPTLGFCRKKDEKSWYGKKRRDFFVQHMEDTIRHLYNHPCVVAYTIFNEGWGQFESDAMYRRCRELDDTRLYDATSGWFSQKESDFDSQHIYFKKLEIPGEPEKPDKSEKSDKTESPDKPDKSEKSDKTESPDKPEKTGKPCKPVLVSECGGYSLRVPGHFYTKYARYGYGECKNKTELTFRVKKLYEETILPGIPKGVCGCIYTQLSDVEDEVNGFYTYDRKVCKVEAAVMREIALKLSEAVRQP